MVISTDGIIYLSHVIDILEFKRGQANIIIAPCHSGKTTAAIQKIAALAECRERVIFLIDTNIGKNAFSSNTSLIFDGNNNPFRFIDGGLYDNALTKIIYFTNYGRVLQPFFLPFFLPASFLPFFHTETVN